MMILTENLCTEPRFTLKQLMTIVRAQKGDWLLSLFCESTDDADRLYEYLYCLVDFSRLDESC